jgi:hypothetical protein
MQEKGTAGFVEAFAVPLRMASRGQVCCVRLWKVDVVSCKPELLPLAAGLLATGLLAAGLLAAGFLSTTTGLLTAGFLSTFFGCHRLLLLLFDLKLQPQDTVSNFFLWPSVSGAQHVGI